MSDGERHLPLDGAQRWRAARFRRIHIAKSCERSATGNAKLAGTVIEYYSEHLALVAVKIGATIYLCDYFTLSDFRHAIYQVLARGESVHALQRAIRIGTIPVRRGRDLAEIGVVSGALALMTNLVMAYNAGQLQSGEAEIASGAELAECIKTLEHVGPVAYGHINFRGTYSFPIDRYATRILRLAASHDELVGDTCRHGTAWAHKWHDTVRRATQTTCRGRWGSLVTPFQVGPLPADFRALRRRRSARH
jgi:Tn3 transposase DDE domain